MDLHQLQKCDFFQGLSEEEIASLLFANPGATRKYTTGDLIVHQGDICDKIAVLSAGAICSYMENEFGKELMVKELQSPTVIGICYIFASNNHYTVNVKAKTDCEITFISKQLLNKIMDENPRFRESFIRASSDRVLGVFSLLYQMNLNNLKQRLLNYLKINPDVKSVTEMAKYLNVTRPSLSRALAELKRDGLIDR